LVDTHESREPLLLHGAHGLNALTSPCCTYRSLTTYTPSVLAMVTFRHRNVSLCF